MIRLVNAIATLVTIGFAVGLIVDPGLAVPFGSVWIPRRASLRRHQDG